jgi:hypothetical protein
MSTRFCLENLKGRVQSEDLGVDGNMVGSCGLDASGS